MTNTAKETKTAMFRHNEVIYTREKTGYCYAQPVGGIKKRIGKADFEKAYNEYVSDTTTDAEWQAQADLEKEQQEIAKQAQYEADEKAVLGDVPEATEKAQDNKTDEQPSEEKKAPKKAKKAPRKSKDIALEAKLTDGKVITLTAKQVDFIRHIPDTSFYEHGLDSTPWCDVLTDEIGGQFAGKPMTVGAMISTLREKGIIYVSMEKVNGKKAKYFGFTEIGKKIAKELGLH